MPDIDLIKKAGMPLTPYDFLGYLAPGGTLLLCLALFDHTLRRIMPRPKYLLHTPLLSAFKEMWPTGTDLLSATVFLLILSGLAYIAGHLVSSVSAICMDRIFIAKGYGYPFEVLLNLPNNQRQSTEVSKSYYKGLFFWVNVYFVIRFYSELPASIVSPPIAAYSARAGNYVGWFIVAITVLKIFIGIKYTTSNGVNKWISETRGFRFFSPIFCWLINRTFPIFYDIPARTISSYLHTRSSFSAEFITRYKTLFAEQFQFDPELEGTNNFWLTSLYVKARSEALSQMATNWLSLYAFARNLATAFYMGFIYCVVVLWMRSDLVQNTNVDNAYVLLTPPAIYFVAAFFMLMRYYYLYVSYYSKFTFRSFVLLCDEEKRKRGPNSA